MPAARYLTRESEDGAVDCVKIVAQMFANNHLPPQELRTAVLATFVEASGPSLVQYLRRHSETFGVRVFLEKIDQMRVGV
jgi:hypothetical protein